MKRVPVHKQQEAIADATRSAMWKTSRHVGIDARRREAKRWRTLFKHYIKQTGGRHGPIVEQLCSLLVQQEGLTARQLRGEPGLELKITKTASQVTYVMRQLGLMAKDDDAEQAERDMREAGLL